MVRYTLRAAAIADVDVLVRFTIEEAREAEGEELNVEDARRGVRAAFEDASLATYWVAESSEGIVVASTSTVKEWSNFHGGFYWWIQSLFIAPGHRGSGLAETMLEHLTAEAARVGALELRLYVHEGNERAIRAYRRSGFLPSRYMIMSRSPAGTRDTRIPV